MKNRLYFVNFLTVATLVATLFATYKVVFTNDWNFYFAGWIPWICLSLTGLLMGLSEKIQRVMDARFRLMLATAFADGEISPEEAAVLGLVAKKFGISDKRVKKDIEDLAKGTLQYYIPEDDAEKKVLLDGMIGIMRVDNKIDEREKALVFELGKKLGYSESYIKSRL